MKNKCEDLIVAKEWYRIAKEQNNKLAIEILENKFPELKESEDERVRNFLIGYFDKLIDENSEWGLTKETREKIITWLEKQGNLMKALQISNAKIGELIEENYYLKEKQGEHAKFRDSIQIGDKVTRNEDGVLVNLSQLKRVAKPAEKQGKQKPIEPQQDMLSQEKYAKAVDECIYGEQKPAEWSEDDKKMSRFIGNAITADDASIYLESKGIQVIDAHVWLEKLKERVQPQPKQDWSAEDEVKINRIVACLENLNVADNDILLKDVDWLKSLKDRVQPKPRQEWSEEDEDMFKKFVSLIPQCMTANSYNEYINWFKSLKDRVLPTEQDWSEEDRKTIETAIKVCQSNGFSETAIYLKSLKDRVLPQNTWKPSDKQLHYLSWIANVKLGDGIVEQEVSKHLNELYEDLKKLRGK